MHRDHAWLLQPQTQKDYGVAIGKAAERYLLSTQTDGEISVFVNGEKLAFDQPPVIQQDRTLVPMRAIFEALGATVLWDESTQTVTAEEKWRHCDSYHWEARSCIKTDSRSH